MPSRPLTAAAVVPLRTHSHLFVLGRFPAHCPAQGARGRCRLAKCLRGRGTAGVPHADDLRPHPSGPRATYLRLSESISPFPSSSPLRHGSFSACACVHCAGGESGASVWAFFPRERAPRVVGVVSSESKQSGLAPSPEGAGGSEALLVLLGRAIALMVEALTAPSVWGRWSLRRAQRLTPKG